AIYLDSGYDATRHTIDLHFSSLIERDIASTSHSDYKSQLQEHIQTTHGIPPRYTVIGETGPDHNKTFIVQLVIEDLTTEGEGRSKKIAEQDAARNALDMLGKNEDAR
ncbi:MAG: putative dsRNA-binding protein, partial [Desulfobacterales bacterium]